jgi:hypothetical protein
MAFEWLTRFQCEREKTPDYAEKALSTYRRGLNAKGAIVGICIEPAPDCCESARQLQTGKVYGPEEVPSIPLSGCAISRRCGCVYRPVMNYQQSVSASSVAKQAQRAEEGS